MKLKITTLFALATLIAYAVADRGRTKTHKDYENDGYGEIEDDPANGSNEGDASVSKNSGCGRNIDKSNSNEDYGRGDPYERGNHRRNGYSSKASSAASADASANAYERGHSNRPSI